MTGRPSEASGLGVAVFPYLKTSAPITLGGFTFRSTDDRTGLSEADADHVRDIADMLFLQDDFRIKSATYALLPPLDFTDPELSFRELEQLQAIVAYWYSAPHSTFGDPLLPFEQASLAIFSPEPVPIDLVRPEYQHVVATGPQVELHPDQRRRVPGYEGRYNFRHAFWVVRGSRLYPPIPHLGLNISQDLALDVRRLIATPQHQLLLDLLPAATTETALRVLTALTWYNRANSLSRDEESAIIDLAVAFETLLALPRDAKTDRFKDAVSLILGRIPRVDLWASQFYAARSDVAHEGRTERLHFIPTPHPKSADGPRYRSLLAYGRQIFQLCVSALLFGAHLGARAGLQDKLTTNQERFESICRTLDDDTLTVADRFAAIAEPVELANAYRFVGEPGLRVDTLLGTIQRAAKTLLLCSEPLDPALMQCVEELANAQRSADAYEVLRALQTLHEVKTAPPAPPRSPQAIMRLLTEIVWGYTFIQYFWLKEQRE
jgi:hypothetical protein